MIKIVPTPAQVISFWLFMSCFGATIGLILAAAAILLAQWVGYPTLSGGRAAFCEMASLTGGLGVPALVAMAMLRKP
ncbi:MAG: hypothetical protein E6Q76_08190 [Rhizobium sp.]|nr:MAG: hypothetical protein E6Q76_08190 [Rhizobium sp.]